MNFKNMAMLTSKKILEYTFEDLEIYTYTETQINSNMYVVLSGKNGMIIDPIVNDEVLDMMYEHKVQVLKILLTHEHYDHISGVNYYKEQLPCVVICSSLCAEALPYPRKNLSRYYSLVIQAHMGKTVLSDVKINSCTYSCSADEVFKKYYEFMFEKHHITIQSVGGHSEGSSFIFFDKDAIFTGDNLIPGTKTINILPGGSEESYLKVVKPFVSSLEPKMLVFPGHGIPMVLKDILEAHPDYNQC